MKQSYVYSFLAGVYFDRVYLFYRLCLQGYIHWGGACRVYRPI